MPSQYNACPPESKSKSKPTSMSQSRDLSSKSHTARPSSSSKPSSIGYPGKSSSSSGLRQASGTAPLGIKHSSSSKSHGAQSSSQSHSVPQNDPQLMAPIYEENDGPSVSAHAPNMGRGAHGTIGPQQSSLPSTALVRRDREPAHIEKRELVGRSREQRLQDNKDQLQDAMDQLKINGQIFEVKRAARNQTREFQHAERVDDIVDSRNTRQLDRMAARVEDEDDAHDRMRQSERLHGMHHRASPMLHPVVDVVEYVPLVPVRPGPVFYECDPYGRPYYDPYR